MQIHELNNFTGTLGSGAYLAIDNGTDTGKISSQGLLAATEARIDNIIAGEAPSAEEIVDARLGADGVVYPSLGDAIRDQFTDVKSDLSDTLDLIGTELLTGSVAWEVGSLNITDGGNLASTTRIRTVDYIDISNLTSLTFDVDTGYKYVVDWYDSNKSFKKVTIATTWQTTDQTVTIPNDVAYMRLLISANPDATANVSFAEHLSCRGENLLIGDVKHLIANEPSYMQATNVRVIATSILADMNDAEPNKIYNISNILQSISNIPPDLPSTTINGTMWVVCGEVSETTNWRVQFLVTADVDPIIFYRNKSSNTWKAWKKIAVASPSDANLLSLDYYNATAVNKLEIGSIQNKTILTFGDSITAGSENTSWTYHFASMTGSTINNKAVAGASFGESQAESSVKYISTQINGVSASEWENADIVIVSAGTNDGLINTPHDELKEKVQSAITAIKTATNAPIVFITPIRRNTPSYSENLKLPLIAGIISNVALINECNVICGYTFPIPSETIDEITNITRDGLHPNATGANVYARSVINALV